jgi:hypothetical protein
VTVLIGHMYGMNTISIEKEKSLGTIPSMRITVEK